VTFGADEEEAYETWLDTFECYRKHYFDFIPSLKSDDELEFTQDGKNVDLYTADSFHGLELKYKIAMNRTHGIDLERKTSGLHLFGALNTFKYFKSGWFGLQTVVNDFLDLQFHSNAVDSDTTSS
jgi:hypothetical protein